MNEPKILAISGVKNSGKTTLITRLIPFFTQKGIQVATVKHDGHDFEPDVPGTDTYRHLQAGAYGAAVYSAGKWMVTKRQPEVTADQMIALFPEVDLIILEGMKHSRFPKIELVREGNSSGCVCETASMIAVATDIDHTEEGLAMPEKIPVLPLNSPKQIADFIENWMKNQLA